MVRINDLLLRRRTTPRELVPSAISYPVVTSRPEARAISPAPAVKDAFTKPLDRPSLEMLQLIYALRAVGIGESPSVMQLIGCQKMLDARFIAQGLADLAAAQDGQEVLVIEQSSAYGTGRPSLIDAYRRTRTIADAIGRSLPGSRFSSCTLSQSDHAMLDIAGTDLKTILEDVRGLYGMTILDSSAAGELDAAALSRHCDATILLVDGQTATRAAIERTRENIYRLGGRPLGVILINRDLHLPEWLSHILGQ